MRIVALVLLAACSSEDPRTALIVNTLVREDLDLIALRPDRVAEKYQAMTETAQTYLRGSAAVFYRDLTRTYGDGTVHHGDPELIWLYADPHLENVGTTFDETGPMFDGIDFDSSLQGPFDWDVRRAALALAVGAHMAGLDDTVSDAARALAEGWRSQMPGPLRPVDLGRIAADELATGASHEADRQDLTRYTSVDANGVRKLLRAADMVEVPAPFAAELDVALRDWNHTRRGGALPASYLHIKDAIEKLGSGISSLPNLRFWLLIEGPDGVDDDRILELKEERDPPQPIAWLGTGPMPPDNGARVVMGSAVLLSSPQAEPDLGHVTLENVAFQVRSVSRGRREVNVGDLVTDVMSGKFVAADMVDLGRDIGRLIGAGHARQASGLLQAAGASFSDDTARNASSDLTQLLADYDRFRDALKRRGPLLGARP